MSLPGMMPDIIGRPVIIRNVLIIANLVDGCPVRVGNSVVVGNPVIGGNIVIVGNPVIVANFTSVRYTVNDVSYIYTIRRALCNCTCLENLIESRCCECCFEIGIYLLFTGFMFLVIFAIAAMI